MAALPKEELLEEIGIPLTPIRLKCAILGLGVLKVALHRAKGTPLPDEWQGLDTLPDAMDVAPVEELPAGLDEDRGGRRASASASTTAAASCTRSRTVARTTTGPLCHGAWDEEACTVICPRHGSQFDLKTGKPLTLPAYVPVRTFPVRVEDGMVKVGCPEPRGLSVLTEWLHCPLPRKGGGPVDGDFQYGQWRYQLVEARPRDLTGIA